MTDKATVAYKVKSALYEAARTLYDPDTVLVSFGLSTARADLNEMVALLEVRVRQEQGPLSATNRSRDEYVEQQVVISVFRAGPHDDREVSEAAYEHLRKLEYYVRQTDTTLGGVAMHCQLTEHESYGYTQVENLSHGRLCEIEATFTARVRITG